MYKFFSLYKTKLSTNKGADEMKGNFVTYALIGLVTGLGNGLFGSGGGTIAVPCMEKFLKVEEHKAHATAIAIILPLSILSGFLYLRGVRFDLESAFFVSVGGIGGGYIGAKTLNKISGRWLHIVFGIFMLAAAVRLIFW